MLSKEFYVYDVGKSVAANQTLKHIIHTLTFSPNPVSSLSTVAPSSSAQSYFRAYVCPVSQQMPSGPPPCPLAPTTTTGRTANSQRPIAVPPRADDHHRPHLAVAASPRSIAAARCALDAASTRGFGTKRPNPFLFENIQLADLTAPKGNCKN